MQAQSPRARIFLDISECFRLSNIITIKLRMIIMCVIYVGHSTHTVALQFIFIN